MAAGAFGVKAVLDKWAPLMPGRWCVLKIVAKTSTGRSATLRIFQGLRIGFARPDCCKTALKWITYARAACGPSRGEYQVRVLRLGGQWRWRAAFACALLVGVVGGLFRRLIRRRLRRLRSGAGRLR